MTGEKYKNNEEELEDEIAQLYTDTHRVYQTSVGDSQRGSYSYRDQCAQQRNYVGVGSTGATIQPCY